jgi:hypothetical protein
MKTIDHLLGTGWFKTSASNSKNRSWIEHESIHCDFNDAAVAVTTSPGNFLINGT